MESIPGPRGLPFVGNMFDVLGEETRLRGLEHLAEIYGPIYRLNAADGHRRIVCSSAELMAELVDEKRFVKSAPAALSGGGVTGLFAAENENPDWGQLHRILMPAFGPLAIEGMFDEMKDIAGQLVLKWARKGSEKLLATDEFTRLTLDTIALCAMDYRFNSFYQDAMHPFVGAMLNVLEEGGNRASRPQILTKFMYARNAKFEEDVEYQQQVAREIIDYRRDHPTDKKDILNAMINGVDPKTGEHLRDELIIAQMVGFLVAGHETTSGLLSFCILSLLKNPAAYRAAQEEVDEVIGKGSIEVHHLNQLKYITAVLRETLRLFPTAPIIIKKVNPKLSHDIVTLGGKYNVDSGDRCVLLIGKSQQDVHVYGEDASEFKPERMLDEEYDKLPGSSWQPFSSGSRGCIGRPFAWQEALLVTALLLQNFQLHLDDPAYQVRLRQTLTIKPKDLYIRATLRDGIDPTTLDQSIHGRSSSTKEAERSVKHGASPNGSTKRKPMVILYGSNTGTCQSFAQRLAADASSRGFEPTVMEMDAATTQLPKATPVVIITSSYEGQPPDNAARFVDWLQVLEGSALEGTEYAVFGCGHHDWASTFHRIPNLTDSEMEARGARRIAPKGLPDMAKGHAFGDFEDWLDEALWPNLSDGEPGVAMQPMDSMLEVELTTRARASHLRHDVDLGSVVSVQTITSEGEPQKYHMEVQLPSESVYECGDYLAVLPLNPDAVVRRAMNHFKLPWDAVLTLKTAGPSIIPANTPLAVYDVLRGYVELSEPATKKSLRTCIRYTAKAEAQSSLEILIADPDLFAERVLSKRLSVLDLLLQRPSIALPFNEFLAMLSPMRVRQYSISSSPLHDPTTCTITWGILDQPSLSDPDIHFQGVASTYLQSLKPGDTIQVSIRPTAKKNFRLPVDDASTPLLLFCAGTGLAPFRGFIQQRSIQLQANPSRKLARALLFIGCRSQTRDRLYAEELDEWARHGAVELRYAFSQEREKTKDCQYVAERMLEEKEEVADMWRQGARIYVCGSREFAKSLRKTAEYMVIANFLRKEPLQKEDEETFERWFQGRMEERVASDVFD